MERAQTRRITAHPAPARGFTLVEMVVTVLIIGILASFSYVTYTKAVDNQRQTDATAQTKVIAAANQQYHNDYGAYTGINTLISKNYLANQNWSSPYFTYAGGTPGNSCLAAQATPNAGYPSLTPIYIDPAGRASPTAPTSCNQYGGVASTTPQMVSPTPTINPPPAPSSLCTPNPCPSPSQVACGETFTDNCGNACSPDVGTKCSATGASCNGGVCSGGSSSSSPPPPPPPSCTPSCSPTLACGSTAPNGCGGTCHGTRCGAGSTCVHSLFCTPLSGGGCFVSGTPVMTPSGSVPIEKIKPGDVVYSADPASYALVPEKIRATEVKTVRVLVEVVLSNGLKIETTPIHPFFDPADGRFKEIQYFKPGDSVAFLENIGAAPQNVALAQGDPHFTPALEWNVKITSLRRVKKISTVYNLTMSKPYADFLVDGILVHNKPITQIP